ncbi:unnamed protein product [Rhodiola kirilowii]
MSLKGFDYELILGLYCEMPVGYVQIRLPIGVAGPFWKNKPSFVTRFRFCAFSGSKFCFSHSFLVKRPTSSASVVFQLGVGSGRQEGLNKPSSSAGMASVRATRGRHRRENQAEQRILRIIYHQLCFLCKSAIMYLKFFGNFSDFTTSPVTFPMAAIAKD